MGHKGDKLVNQETLNSAIAKFKFHPAEEQRLEDLRQQFVQRFPLSGLKNLTLERYALGLEPKENSFCWWIEYRTKELGRISGASARMHIVYFDRDEKTYWVDPAFNSKEAAFEVIRKGIVELTQLAQQERYDLLERVTPFVGKKLTRGKILFLYFPDKFLPIFSLQHLKDLCNQLGVRVDFDSQIDMNRALLLFKNSHPVLKEWSSLGFANFLYEQFSPTVQFWKIAPGERAKYWNQCRDGGYICIGWDELGDLNGYSDKESFEQAFRNTNFPKAGTKWREVWDFRHEIKKGDIIVANNGLTMILGIGKATGDYWFDERRSELKNCIGVEWQDTRPISLAGAAAAVSSDWGFRTVKKLEREQYNTLVGNRSTTRVLWRRVASHDLQAVNPEQIDIAQATELYTQVVAPASIGPISRGLETKLATWLKNPASVLEEDVYVLLSNWFLSSDIIMGSDRSRLSGELWDVLFACRPPRLSSKTSNNSKVIPEAFDEWWRQMKALGATMDDAAQLSNQTSLPSDTTTSRYVDICQKTYLPESFFRDCEQLLQAKRQIVLQGAPGTGKTFVADHLAELWAGSRERVKVVQFHESYGYEDFIYGIKPRPSANGTGTAFTPEPGLFVKFCEHVRKEEEKNFVLLIDEINRAKAARVFGELLYLLEYRERNIELQNGSLFSIPKNLYIIATMNTTDKSIALVDYALRRRFAFIALAPVIEGKSTVLRCWLQENGISNADEVERLFVTLNQEIARKGDEALMVGHSYFMVEQAKNEHHFSEELLNFIWRYYVLPLIAEYRYELSSADLEAQYGLAALRATPLAKGATA